MNLRTPRTPNLAEGAFKHLCDLAGVIANKSGDDQMGWDYLVEFPVLPNEDPADLRPGLPACLVQVKSTRASKRACTVKLSNAVRFAQSQQPCFLVLFVHDAAGRELLEVYVRHIWRDEIAGALERARQAHVDQKPLHRIERNIRFRAEERCAPEALIQHIEAEIEAHGPDYAGVKGRIAASVGYEEGRGEAVLTLDAADSEALVDVMLGRREDVPILNFRFQESRFGLPGREQLFGEGRLSVEPEPRTVCKVVVQRAGSTEELVLDGELHAPGIPGLPEALRRIRVQAEFLEIIYRGDGRTEASAKFSGSRPISIGEAQRLTTFRSWAASGPLTVQLVFPDKPPVGGTITMTPSDEDAGWHRLSRAIGGLLKFAPLNRWPATARFTLLDLSEGLPVLEAFVSAVTEPGRTIRMQHQSGDEVTAVPKIDTYFGPIYLELEPVTLFGIYTAPLEAHVQDGCLSVVLGPPTLLQRLVLPGAVREHHDYMRRLVENARSDAPRGPTVMYAQLADLEPVDPAPEALA